MTKAKAKNALKNKAGMEHLPLPTLRRLPYYYNILCAYEKNGFKYVSSAMIAKKLGVDDTQVRKDIASTGYIGKPKVGFNTTEFKLHLENFLGMNDLKDAVLIGTGNLGIALAKYDGFKQFGLDITALFDKDDTKVGLSIEGKEIQPINKLETYLKKHPVKIAILTMHSENAQEVADILVKSKVKAIWNFTSTNLELPEDVFVWNENLAASFIVLSQFIIREM